MKNKFGKLSVVLCLVVTLVLTLVPMFAFSASAESATVTKTHAEITKAAGKATTDNTSLNGVDIKLDDYITVRFDKNKSTSNPAYYSGGIRLYQGGGTLKITSPDAQISKIVITTDSSYNGNGGTAQGGTLTISGTTLTIDGITNPNEVVFTTQTNKAGRLYVKSIAVTYEVAPEADPECQHTNTTVETEPATKTTDGWKKTVCDDCGGTIGEVEIIPALGCATTFVVPEGVIAPELDAAVEITMPDAAELPEGDYAQDYTFAGWAMADVAEDTTDEPTLYEPGAKVKLTDDTTFYAIYSYGVAGEMVQQYDKVTAAPEDWSGTYLIVYENAGKAYIFNGQDAVNGYVSATISNGVIASNNDVDACQVVIAPMTNGYSLKFGTKGYMYGTSGSNKLNFNATTAQLNTISFDSGKVNIVSNTSTFKFNNASNQMRFRYYGSGQQSVTLYKYVEGEGVATYYTTNIEAAAPAPVETAITNAAVNLGSDLSLQFYTQLADGKDIANFKMVFTVNGRDIEATEAAEYNGLYVFTLYGLAPQQMGDRVDAKLYEGDEVVATVEGYSIQKYANYVIADESGAYTAEEKQLVIDMLYYGKAAQDYVDYIVDYEDGTTNEIIPVGTATEEAPEMEAAAPVNTEFATPDAYIAAAGVQFDYVNKLYVKINATDVENVVVKINGVEVELVKNGSIYIVYTDAISATEFGTVFTFELYVDGNLAQTLEYSVNAYANAKWDAANETTKALAQALYRYGYAASKV